VLLGNANIKIALRKALGEFGQAGSFAHGRRNADQALVGGGHIVQPATKDLGIGGAQRDFRADALLNFKLADTVIKAGIGFGQVVAFALLRDDMQELRAFEFADVEQRWHQRIQVVAINRAKVVEAELFKQRARRHHALDVFFRALGQLVDGRQGGEKTFAARAQVVVEAAGEQFGEVAVERADIS